MKASRIPILSGLVLLLLLAASSQLHATLLHPTCNSSAILLHQASDSVSIGTLWGTSDGSKGTYEILIFRLSNGDTTIVIDPETVTFSGPCSGLDNVDLTTLFTYISREAVRDAVDDGRIGSTTNCSARFAATVMVPTCVTRIGYGAGTTFLNGDDCTQSTRTFAHCIGGAPQMMSLTGIAPCVDGESTCEEEGGGGLN